MTIHALGPFRLDTEAGLLLRGTEPVALGTRAIALLRALVERPGGLVSKDALIEAAWPGQAVEDSNLTVQIAAIRRVLGTAPGGGGWIETMPRRGYRFVGPVVTEGQKGVTEAPQAEAAPDLAPTKHGEAERRQITALSCELVGVAAAADGADLEDLREVVGDFRRCVSETASRHAGSIYRHLGNNVLVLFGYPEAHENDAERAVRAGLELCAAVKALRAEANAPIKCRVGIATGMVIIGDPVGLGALRVQEIVGEAPSVASRLLAAAPPHTVAIDPASRRLIGNLFDCRALGAIETAGGIEPVRGWQVLAESAVESRFEALHGSVLTPLVGRDEEIDLLLRRWARATAGDGQAVLISGEPGIGKSRIVAALGERLHDEPHLRLRYFCSPYHQDSALFPFIGQLGDAAGFARYDTLAAKREKLEALLARAAPADEDVGFLADLLSLPGSERHPLPNLSLQRKKQRTLEALLRQLEGLARRQPVVLVFEDAHWIDPTSRELLDLIVAHVARLPVLLIVTFRPEFQPPWTGQPHVTVLMLNRLDGYDRTALVEQIAGGKALPDEVVGRLVDRSDGVPLFIEELTKSVLESGLLREERDRYVLDGPLPQFAIPTTLHGSLLARLDRVGSARYVAQIGAVIGREFSYALVRAVSDLPDDELRGALASLVASELVFQRGTPPDAVYSFKHSLVQDAAHGTVLRRARQQLHARVADALEAQSPELMDTQPELFAQHYAEAGLVEKSVICWGKAGQRSAARSAMAEATAQLQKGLDQLTLLPDDPQHQRQQLEFWSALGAVLLVLKGTAAPEAGEALARARDLWEQLGFPFEFLHIPFNQYRHLVNRGELDLALHLAEEVLNVSRGRDDSAGLILGHTSFARSMMLAGRFALSRSHYEEVLALYEPGAHPSLVHQAAIYPHLESQAYLGFVLFCLGFPDQASAQSSAAIAEARRLAHPPSLAAIVATGAGLHTFSGDDAALGERADELAVVTTERGYPTWGPLVPLFGGWAKVRRGNVAEGIPLLRDGLSAYRATGAVSWLPQFIPLLARAYGIAGQIEEAITQLDETLQIIDRTGERWFEAEVCRLKGQLLLRQGLREAAEELYRRALSIAREQEAKLWELRATVELARLRHDQGRQTDARNLLVPVYAWFTEGFDTPDLKEAKALLGKLA